MEETEDQVEAEETEEDGDEEEAGEESPSEAVPQPPDQPTGDVESIEGLLAKKEGRKRGDDDEDPMVPAGREDRLEPLAVKVVPQQPTEFVCNNCHLVKHQSQLADKKRVFCRDCA